MNKKHTVKFVLINMALVLSIIFNTIGLEPALAKSNRYVALERVTTKNPDLDLFINEKSQTIDLARTQNIRVRIKAKDLYNSIDRTSSFKISTFERNGTERTFISSQQLSIFKGFRRSRVLSISAGEFTSPTKILEFDIYDTAGNVINTYKTTITAINLESQISGSTGINIAEADCDGSTFGECQIDYFLQRVQFEAKPQRQASTRVIKTKDGLYKVTFPFPRSKFKFLGRKVRRKAKDDFDSGTGTGTGVADFGETINLSTVNIGNSLSESQFLSYTPNGDLTFNDNVFLDLEGKLGIGVKPPQAWLHVRNGNSVSPSIKIGQGPLTTVPVDGALEYDGTNLYFTVGSTRSVVGAGGGGSSSTTNGTITNNNVTQTVNQGSITFNGTSITNKNTIGNHYNSTDNYFNQTTQYQNSTISYENGTVVQFSDGSYIQNSVLNGTILTTNNSTLKVNGSLLIPGGSQNQVLTYINGYALWRSASAVANGITTVSNNITQVYNQGNLLFNQTTLNHNGVIANYYDSTQNFYNGNSNYFNQSVLFKNGNTTLDNSIFTFVNGSYLQNAVLNGTLTIPGGSQNQVLTYINGDAVWRNSSATANGGTTNFYNGASNYFNQSILYDNSNVLVNNTNISFVNGSLLEDPNFNGDIFFTNNSVAQINGSLTIPSGAANGYVLTSDTLGNATWQAPAGGGQWTDIGTALHPSDLSGAETVLIGGTTTGTADIELSATGGAIFNKQAGTDDFVVNNAAGQAFTIEGNNGNIVVATAGLTNQATFTLLDTTQAVSFSMLPSGGANGSLIVADDAGLTINGSSSFTVNVDAGSQELYVNGDTVSVGANTGDATLNVDGSLALIGTGTQLITPAGGITADSTFTKIAGNGGAITITANPQITVSGSLQDGQLLILKGTSDANTVTIVEGNGVSLTSGLDFTLGAKDVLQLIYDSADSEWIEMLRSDK